MLNKELKFLQGNKNLELIFQIEKVGRARH